jgi:hypothetical protein
VRNLRCKESLELSDAMTNVLVRYHAPKNSPSLNMPRVGRFLGKPRYDSVSNRSLPDEKDGASRITLRKDCLFLQKCYDFATLANNAKNLPESRLRLFLANEIGGIRGFFGRGLRRTHMYQNGDHK